MKRIVLICCVCCCFMVSFAQNVGIGTTAPDNSAKLDIQSTARGLLIPSMTQSQVYAIPAPATGLLLFQTDHTPGFYYNAGTPAAPSWQPVSSAAGPTDWKLTGNGGTDAATDFVGTADNKPFLFRINNVTAGYLDSLKAKTFLGYGAGHTGSSGYGSVAAGKNALAMDSTGIALVAVGDSALSSSNQSTGSVAVGYYTLAGTPYSLNNTAVGSYSLNTASGTYNTATGAYSLFQNTQSGNTAKGFGTLGQNILGGNNTAFGLNALGSYSSDYGSYQNTAAGMNALYANESGGSNTASGYNALANNRTGGYNTATGNAALLYNITGGSNTATGDSALASANGSSGTAIGAYSQQNGGPGPEGKTTSVGAYSLRNNAAGVLSTAVGANALYYNSGKANTATGYYALSGTGQNGDDNTAFGAYTLMRVVVNDVGNTAYGNYALTYSAGGDYNTAAGFASLYILQSSKYNTAIGALAGSQHYLSHANVILGANCDFSTDGLTNCIVIGQDVACTDNNQVRIGNLATNSIGGQVGWSTLSDGRFKKNIRENVKGLDFILRLKPITYNLDIDMINDRLHPKGVGALAGAADGPGKLAAVAKEPGTPTTGSKGPATMTAVAKVSDAPNAAMRTAMIASGRMVHSGFVAQDVEKAALDAGFNFSGVDRPSSENGLYGLRYEDFVVPLIKAVQEQQHQIETLQKGNSDINKRIERLNEKIKEH
ncbi:MAG: tail fiber domain-containing protein [Bacteroidetes bacterium]|nr:tail fiber domain-containing protein [Bacteroidota bacterium]